MNYLTQKQFPRRAFLRGVGATVALPFLDAMVPAGRSSALAAATDQTRLICIEEVHGLAGCNNWGASKFLFAPETTGRDYTLVPDNPFSTLEAFRDSDDARQQHRRAQRRSVRPAGNRRRSLPLERGVPHPVAPEADAGLRPVRRHLAGSALRQARRPDHAAAVDAVLHREPRSGGRLHLQLLLRLHRLDQLGVAERAAADDPRPAHRLRHAVRLGQHARGARRRGARPAAASSTGSAARSSASAARSATATASGSTSTWTTCARSSAASRRSRRTTAAAKRARCPTRRPACPIRSPST